MVHPSHQPSDYRRYLIYVPDDWRSANNGRSEHHLHLQWCTQVDSPTGDPSDSDLYRVAVVLDDPSRWMHKDRVAIQCSWLVEAEDADEPSDEVMEEMRRGLEALILEDW